MTPTLSNGRCHHCPRARRFMRCREARRRVRRAGMRAQRARPRPPVGCWRRSTRSPRGRPHSSMHAPPPPAKVRLAPSATGLRQAPSASGSERPPRGTCRWHSWRAQAWRCASATRARAGGARGWLTPRHFRLAAPPLSFCFRFAFARECSGKLSWVVLALPRHSGADKCLS